VSLIHALRRRPLRALQVEVTSRCTRACAVCPRRALNDTWVERDLPAAAWEAIVPALPLAEHVHLQGWGEPLLHPALPEMAAAAKRARCSVGITTNGDLLAGAAEWIVALRVDLVTLSVAGGDTRHALLRDGSDLVVALERVGELAARAVRGRPRVQVAFLLTRENHADMVEVVQRAARLGVREVYVTHLDCTPSPELLAAAAFSPSGLRSGVSESLLAARRAAARAGVRLRTPAESAEELLVCALDPTRLAYVAADGRVGPCAYHLLPITGPIPRADAGGTVDVAPACFGSVPGQTLAALLGGPARRSFAAPFVARRAADQAFRARGLGGFGSPALADLEAADAERLRVLARNPFPPACAGCHKAIGW